MNEFYADNAAGTRIVTSKSSRDDGISYGDYVELFTDLRSNSGRSPEIWVMNRQRQVDGCGCSGYIRG